MANDTERKRTQADEAVREATELLRQAHGLYSDLGADDQRERVSAALDELGDD